MQDKITDSEDYDIRYSDLSDSEFVISWLKDSETAIWYPPETDGDKEVFVRNWLGFSKYKASLTALFKKTPIGVATIYLMPYIKVAHICSLYAIVDPAYQRKGVGVSLLRNLKHLAKQRFRLEAMHCEVYQGAPIERALIKAEFTRIIYQEKYIDFPDGPRARVIYESQL